MKTLILFLLICITGIYTSAQSIVDTTKKWNTLIIGPPYNPMPDEHTETIIFQQDTIINTNTYKKVYRSTDEFMTNWEVYCYIREDTTNKVYMRSDTSSQEYLLYDMGAGLNDTLLITGIESYMSSWDFYSHDMVVTSIDSVLIGNYYRKRITLNDPSTGTNEEWINGMGSMSGILHNASGLVGGDWYQLLCFTENDTLKYQDSTLNSCFIESTNIESAKNTVQNILIYPNPANEKLTISITSPEARQANAQLRIMDVSILDITRKQVKSIKYKGQSKKYIVNVKDLPAGLYFIRAQTYKGVVIKKFVKQ